MAETSVLVATPSFAAGIFVCPPEDARWREENWIGPSHVLAFPRRAVLILRSRRQRVVANPNHVVLYNPDETYRRDLLAPEGDESTFIRLAPDAARELLPPPAGDAPPRFPAVEGGVSDRAALQLHALELSLRPGAPTLDPLAAEERLAAIVSDVTSTVVGAVVDAGGGGTSGSRPMRAATRMDHRALVADARELLSVAYPDPLTLPEIARRVGSSPFHLARAFRAATGQTLHGYREGLRLREALRRLRDGEDDLARLATDLGFASHSHFDDRFRMAFGVSPSAVRPGWTTARRTVRQLRTISEAAALSPA